MMNMVSLWMAAFALSNGEGTQLLALDPLDNPKQLTQASCDGNLHSVKYLERRKEKASWDGRQTQKNFDKMGGDAYSVLPAVPGGVTCLLETQAFFEKLVPATFTSKSDACDDATKAMLSKAESGRKITECRVFGRLRDKPLVAAAYERKGKEALATIAWGNVLHMLPGNAGDDAASCWRAGDGCGFVGGLKIAFTLIGKNETAFVLLWSGNEGESSQVMLIKDKTMKSVQVGYRYWMAL